MISFPNAKINLGLNIVGKMEDGYHEIESVIYPVLWQDALEFKEGNESGFTVHGLNIDGNPHDNLIWKAYTLLKKDFDLPALEFSLLKNIPFGAGLGGGSSDGAFTLKLINQYFKLGIPQGQLEAYALKLGSDCPFFIDNSPKLVSGRGEILDSIPLDLSNYHILIIYPGIRIGTAWAYDQVTTKEKGIFKEYFDEPVKKWKDLIVNDFEMAVFNRYPVLARLKSQLLQTGAEYSSMSGSGSAIYGLYSIKPLMENIEKILHPGFKYYCHQLSLPN